MPDTASASAALYFKCVYYCELAASRDFGGLPGPRFCLGSDLLASAGVAYWCPAPSRRPAPTTLPDTYYPPRHLPTLPDTLLPIPTPLFRRTRQYTTWASWMVSAHAPHAPNLDMHLTQGYLPHLHTIYHSRVRIPLHGPACHL